MSCTPETPCALCSQPIGDCTEVHERVDMDARPVRLVREPICAPCKDQLDAKERAAREAKVIEIAARNESQLRAAIERALAPLPEFRPRVGTAEFQRSVIRELRSIATGYLADLSMLILAASGAGKTTVMATWFEERAAQLRVPRIGEMQFDRQQGCDVHVDADHLEALSRSRSYDIGLLGRYLWIVGHDLAYTRRNSALGEEPALISRAKSVRFLVIDEVGTEPLADHVLLEIVNARYAKKLPTVVTSGLTRAAFDERYGSALFRRLTQQGIGKLIDGHPKQSATTPANLRAVK